MPTKAQTQAVAGRGRKGDDERHIVESTLSVEEAGRLLPEAAKRQEFGVLGSHDLKAKLNEKKLDFDDDCLVFYVCNPKQAHEVLSTDMRISTALLDMFHAPKLRSVAKKVENSVFAIMDALR